MGGKTWSREEEHMFWRVVVPQSPKAVNPSDRLINWETCAQTMQEKMGKGARRRYTKLMLFEHYFQNVTTGHKSPHARKFVLEHKRQLTMVHGEDTRSIMTLRQSPFKPSPISSSRSPAISITAQSRRSSSSGLSIGSEGGPTTLRPMTSQEAATVCIFSPGGVVPQISDSRACSEVDNIAMDPEGMSIPHWPISRVCETNNAVVGRAPVAVMSVQVAMDRYGVKWEGLGQDHLQRFLRDTSVEVQ
ncbi:hypothetical protein PT974_07024 [Cladobotryum mycophilum]|uniref:Myb-like domain-containing protein n=1 Tax=Cladobotryum mycophilum TaxID=491253 RepID=A0ABR0SPB4_9HYPO